MQQGHFREALDAIKKATVPRELAFEKAYCYYRLNKTEEAWQTISESSSDELHIKELKAQILYRLERYEECYSLYRDLIRTTTDDLESERQTNMAAVQVQQVAAGKVEQLVPYNASTAYELVYNVACSQLAGGHIPEAFTTLQEAEQSCRNYLLQEEGASEEELNEEVAIIRVQQGYCLQRQGRDREALSLYNSILKTARPSDAALLAVVNNNMVVINKESNVFDSRKRIKTALVPGLEHKLTSHQRANIALNNCLLAYYTHQDDLCKSECERITREFGNGYGLMAQLVHVGQLCRSGSKGEAVQLLQKWKEAHTADSLLVTLVITHLLLTQNDTSGAISALSSLAECSRYRVGVVSALVTLLTASGQTQAASTLLCQAVDWHTNNKSSSGSQLEELWKRAAEFNLRQGDPVMAAAALHELHRRHPGDVKTLAQLIHAYSQYDTSLAQSLSLELPSLPALGKELDVEGLEASLGPKYLRRAQQQQAAAPASPGSPASPRPGKELKNKKTEEKKRKKKVRLPKNYVEGSEPDPERWLPRWQRKNVKKKKDKRAAAKEVGRGTQGGASDAADKFDITKTAGQYKSQGATHQQQEPQGPRRNMPKKKGGGKKKKGDW